MTETRGYTLWELMMTVAIVGVVAGLGVPSLGRFAQELRLSADTNAFVSGVQLARSEAAKRRQSVIMCNSPDGRRCGEGTFDGGWIVFANADGDRPPTRAAAEPLLQVYRPASAAQIRSNRALFEFRPFTRRSTNGTVTFCDERGLASARRVIISVTGRPRVTTAGSVAATACPPGRG